MSDTKALVQAASLDLLDELDIEVRRWRKNMSGCAWPEKRVIEAPFPKSPKSFLVVAHEVGHVLLHGDGKRRPRWVKEAEAWDFALEMLKFYGIPGSRKLRRWAVPSVTYSFQKAIRRGVDKREIRHAFPHWHYAIQRYYERSVLN